MLSVLLGLIAILHPVTVPHIPAPTLCGPVESNLSFNMCQDFGQTRETIFLVDADRTVTLALSGDFSIYSATVTLSCRLHPASTIAQGYVWASGPIGLSIGYTDAYCLNGAITYRIK